MTGQQMCQAFFQKSRISAECDAWAFGDDADALAELVLRGIKTATCSALPFYELEGEPLPREGQYSVILDSRERAVCVIQTTRVYQTSFRQITAEHAWKEGEGDRSLAYWRQVHEAFFSKELSEMEMAFSQDLMLVCEEFQRVYP